MQKLLSSSGTIPSSPTTERVVRTGVLHVTHQRFLGIRWWKPRYVILTPTKLFLYTFEGGELKHELDISTCTHEDIQVMPTDCAKQSGFGGVSIWRIGLNNVNGKRLLLAAASEYEMNMWVQDLYEAAHCRLNPGSEMRPSMGANPRLLEACYIQGDAIGSKFRASIRRPPPPRSSSFDMSIVA